MLVTSNSGTTLSDVVNEHQMGVVIVPEDETLLADTIVEITAKDMLRVNARAYAEQYLNKENILKKIMADLG